MQLENQVCSLELAKKLKKLKVEQASLFYWLRPIGDSGKPNGEYFINWKDSNDFCDDDSHDHKSISAFTVAELGELIPNASMETDIRWAKGDGAYWGECWKFGKQVHLIGGEKTEVDCRAKMLIYLLETDII